MIQSIPRLAMADMEPALAERLRPRVERLGYLGEFFQYTAHQPRALISFLTLTEDLKEALPGNLTEVVALSVARLMNNAYERVQHERLSLKLGLGEPWVCAVVSLTADEAGPMSETERRVQKLAIALVTRKGLDCKRELENVITVLGHKQAVAVLFLVGRYLTHALIVNCLELEPPVSSPLDIR